MNAVKLAELCASAKMNDWGYIHMSLSAPSQVTFLLSGLLAILALLVRYAGVAVPVVSGNSFETLLVAFLLLLAGVIFRGF